tara:strand:+ start:120 stop:293 length:174 start_codon:yes stop_codon:yes gene_type:complete
LKYKEYNQIIKDYKAMQKASLANGNDYAANACKAIIEDLELLLKQGILGQFPHKEKK